MKRKSIAIDMDNVIADVVTHFMDWYEKDYGIRIKPEALMGIAETDAFPNNAVRKYVYTPGFFRTVPVMPGAQEAVKKLMTKFDVYIVSAAMEFPQSLSEKLEWLKEHFPFISWRNIIFCGDKSVIATDYLIDDHCKNLDCCSGKALIFTAGHNIKINHHQRVNNWQEVIELLM
jgi:5'(3')-deoxyribonucleotidase